MDCLETASNASDNQSELSSNLSRVSSLSGLTGYEEELYDLKHLVKGSGSQDVSKSSSNNFEVFEERIRKLTLELQNALKLNEKYKNDMYALERKAELAFHEKFEKLMRLNVQLEGQLAVANGRTRDLFGNDDEGKLKLEAKVKECNSSVSLLENEVAHWKGEVRKGEVANNALKVELEEARIDVATKSNSIAALKAKIVDLHVQSQSLTQANIKANNSLLVMVNELTSYKKSELWYKEQLHQSRAQKSQASDELAKLHLRLAAKERDLHEFKANFDNAKRKYDDLNQNFHQEKQNLLKTISKLESKSFNTPIVTETVPDVQLENYEATIHSLTRELVTIKDAVSDQRSSFEVLNKQNAELVTRYTTLQKTLNEKEIAIGNLEGDKKDLSMKLEILTERLRENEGHFMEIVNEKSELEVALNRANHEKQEIEDTVSTIRENFATFANKYKKIKEEVTEKNQQVLALQNERLMHSDCAKRLEISHEKVCQLEELNKELQAQVLNYKQVVEKLELSNEANERLKNEVREQQGAVARLKEQLDANNIDIQEQKDAELEQTRRKFERELWESGQTRLELESEVMVLQKTVGNLKKVLGDKQAELNDKLNLYSQNQQRLENEVKVQQQIVARLNEELSGLKNVMAVSTRTAEFKEQQINSLKSDVALHVQKIYSSEAALEQTRSEFRKVEQLNQLMQRENRELKDKLAKCLTNNINGYCKVNTSQQSELEVWFLCVLDWFLRSLLELQAGGGVKESINELITNCSNEKIRKSLVGLEQVLLSIALEMRAYLERIEMANLDNRQRKHQMAGVVSKMEQIESKFGHINERNEEDKKILHGLKSELAENQALIGHFKAVRSAAAEEKLLEEIKSLRIQCKAKELESKEKRKRYEVNNRTLLKKVKEHMRGRNAAEKRCNYLQQLYNDVFDELNSYKLHETSRDSKIQNLQSSCDNYKNIAAKMKQEILKLERELAVAQAKCVDYEALETRLQLSEKQGQIHAEQLKEMEIVNNSLQLELQSSLFIGNTLKKDKECMLKNIEDLTDSFNESKGEVRQLQGALEERTTEVQELHNKLLAEQKQHSVCSVHLEGARKSVQSLEERSELLFADIKALTLQLDESHSELHSLQAQKSSLETNWCQKEARLQAFVENLQSEIELLQSDVTTLQSDKYFLQRLCSDLKLALQTCMNQSKVLKKHVQTLSAESREFASLPEPAASLPSPSKYDDAYINQLLKQSSASPVDKPLGDLQSCLNSLKKEMVGLKKQVAENAGYRA